MAGIGHEPNDRVQDGSCDFQMPRPVALPAGHVSEGAYVVTEVAHERALLHDARFQLHHQFQQRIDNSGLVRLFRRKRGPYLNALVMDLIDKPRASFDIRLEIVQMSFRRRSNVAWIHYPRTGFYRLPTLEAYLLVDTVRSFRFGPPTRSSQQW
jgi:hypothetical protein